VVGQTVSKQFQVVDVSAILMYIGAEAEAEAEDMVEMEVLLGLVFRLDIWDLVVEAEDTEVPEEPEAWVCHQVLTLLCLAAEGADMEEPEVIMAVVVADMEHQPMAVPEIIYMAVVEADIMGMAELQMLAVEVAVVDTVMAETADLAAVMELAVAPLMLPGVLAFV